MPRRVALRAAVAAVGLAAAACSTRPAPTSPATPTRGATVTAPDRTATERERLACADVARGLAAAAHGGSPDTIANDFADAVSDATGQTARPPAALRPFLARLDRLDLDPATVRQHLPAGRQVQATCRRNRLP